MNDDILELNTPGRVIAVSKEDAEELGAFEETALTEDDAQEATDEQEE